ncbi:sensor histidine kinase [Chitinophaga sp.]|uniref:sensor histidine kinase n=1 Tax=Chitinophaga sp. TaxID=1869181 RepID=UPI0031E1C9D1
MKYTFHTILVVFIVCLTIFVPYPPRHLLTLTARELYYSVMLYNLMAAGGYFLNFYLFIPFFYYRRRMLYFLALILYALSVVYLPVVLSRLFTGFDFLDPLNLPLPQLVLLAAAFMLSYIARKRYEWKQLSEEKTAFELSALKQQMQPHFFFNTLNGIYGLSIKKSPQTPAYILKLASMMRYVLYDSNADKVPLTKELDHIRNYCEMQQLRLGHNNKVELHITGEADGQQIAPFILIPFIENCFKHGISSSRDTIVLIDIHINADTVQFSAVNTIVMTSSHDGVGISNVKRRLELIYPGQYVLTIREQAQQFIVQLNVTL